MFLSLHGQFSSEKDDEFVKLIETQSPGLKTQKRKNGYLACYNMSHIFQLDDFCAPLQCKMGQMGRGFEKCET